MDKEKSGTRYAGLQLLDLLIGSNQGETLLDEISDAAFRLDDLRGDLLALEVIFSVGGG